MTAADAPAMAGPPCGNGHPHLAHDFTRHGVTRHCPGYLTAAVPVPGSARPAGTGGPPGDA
jgi:hypothetical protein